MTEQEWLACTDPEQMLTPFRGNISDRKLRLFAVGCCRYIWKWISDEACRKAVEAADLYADGKLSHRKLEKAMNAADAAAEWGEDSVSADASFACFNAARCEEKPGPYHDYGSAASFALDVIRREDKGNLEQALLYQCHVIRDVVGNPHRSFVLNPACRTESVLAIAQNIYDARRFEDMTILGDALEDARCASQDILNHCRQPGVHVRGCWVLDFVLGKE